MVRLCAYAHTETASPTAKDFIYAQTREDTARTEYGIRHLVAHTCRELLAASSLSWHTLRRCLAGNRSGSRFARNLGFCFRKRARYLHFIPLLPKTTARSQETEIEFAFFATVDKRCILACSVHFQDGQKSGLFGQLRDILRFCDPNRFLNAAAPNCLPTPPMSSDGEKWSEHFVYAFSPQWDSWKCVCRYCGVPVEIKKSALMNHLSQCPVFNSVMFPAIYDA